MQKIHAEDRLQCKAFMSAPVVLHRQRRVVAIEDPGTHAALYKGPLNYSGTDEVIGIFTRSCSETS